MSGWIAPALGLAAGMMISGGIAWLLAPKTKSAIDAGCGASILGAFAWGLLVVALGEQDAFIAIAVFFMALYCFPTSWLAAKLRMRQPDSRRNGSTRE